MRDLESFSEENRTLVTALREGDESLRLAALEEASETVDDELADELLRLLRDDPSEAVRARVPITLGPALEMCDDELDDAGRLPPFGEWFSAPLSQTTYDRLVEALRRTYLDAGVPELVRRRVLEGAVRSPRPWQRQAVAAAYRTTEEPWRVTAVFCMGYLAGFEAEIAEAFRSGSGAVRLEAIRAAGLRGVESLARPLLALAADSKADRDERIAAIEALPSLEHPAAFEVLDLLEDDADPGIAAAAEDALGELAMMAMAEEGFDDDEGLDDDEDLVDDEDLAGEEDGWDDL